MKKNHQETIVEYRDPFSKKVLQMSESEKSKMQFFSYRFFFPLALAIVLYSVTSIELWMILVSMIGLLIFVQLMYLKFKSTHVFLDVTHKVKVAAHRPSNKQTLFRAIVYLVLGLSLAITNIVTSQGKLGINELAVYSISALALYSSFLIFRQIQRGDPR